MHGKGEFSIIKGSICNILIEAANIYNILQRPADSKGLIVKLKRDLRTEIMIILSQYTQISYNGH